MRLFYSIVFTTVLLSCNERKNVAASNIPPPEPKGEFYPVYQLSPKTTAFVVNFSEDSKKGLLDSIFDQIVHIDSGSVCNMPDCSVYDSTGPYILVQNDRLTTEIKKHFDKEYYICGTQGNTKAAIKAIVFGLEECRTNIIAFCLDDSALTSIGHPVFCSEREISLRRSDDYTRFEKDIESYRSRTPSDFSDSIKVKVLGNFGNFYFTYDDDFLWWQKQQDPKCKFPTRGIYKIDSVDSVSQYWAEGLDLFGIPCE